MFCVEAAKISKIGRPSRGKEDIRPAEVKKMGLFYKPYVERVPVIFSLIGFQCSDNGKNQTNKTYSNRQENTNDS